MKTKDISISAFLQKCEKESLFLPESPYDATIEAINALKVAQGDEEEALSHLKRKLGNGNKRERVDYQSESQDEDMSHESKRTRLTMEIRSEPARRKENQKIVDAFLEYAESQLERGHTGKGSTHLRAAREIRDSDIVIQSGSEARQIGFIGDVMARQIDDILETGKIIDGSPDMNVSKDYEHNHPSIVNDIRNTPAKCKENQKLVDALAKYGEHELEYGNTGTGTSHLRAAKELHNTDKVITSGSQAKAVVGFIGDVMANKIDQILAHGSFDASIGSESKRKQSHRIPGKPAPIVKDLRENPARHSENQFIVDCLTDYGESHLTSGHRGTGISHLRAAREIRNSDLVIKSGTGARKIGMVGDRVARKIDQIFRDGHADDDEDYHPDQEGDEGEQEDYGSSHRGSVVPIVEDIRSKAAIKKENQKLVDALTTYGEEQLQQTHTGRGITYLRAAREIRNSSTVIRSADDAKRIAMVGNKVAEWIGKNLN